jgi:hypothetical protein
MSDITKDHLGRRMTAEEIVKQLAVMLGWGNTPPWYLLERELSIKLARLKELETKTHRHGEPHKLHIEPERK